jgi:hypothetical protein
MNPDGLTDMGVHCTTARVVWHRVCFVHDSVAVGNKVDEGESECCVANTRSPKADVSHVRSWKLDCCPVGCNCAQAPSDRVSAACDTPWDVTLCIRLRLFWHWQRELEQKDRTVAVVAVIMYFLSTCSRERIDEYAMMPPFLSCMHTSK